MALNLSMCIFRIYVLPYLCAMQYFHIAHWFMQLATLAQETRLERQERLVSQGNQRNRDLKNGDEKGGMISKMVTV